MTLQAVIAGFLPVLVFLLGLRLMDSFKLVHRGLLYTAIVAGVAAALVAFAANQAAISWFHVPPEVLRGWVAPPLEELFKAALVAWWIHTDRVGFVVDAAIVGFAVGAGFALTENVYYAVVLEDPSFVLWLVRGLGTAIMHGSTTALFAIFGKALSDRYPRAGALAFVPGLLLGVAIHAVYNQLTLSPIITSAVLLGLMPVLLVAAFDYSERVTRAWLSTGFDGEMEMLEKILDGEVGRTPVGEYLEALRSRFSPMIVADLFCLLTIHLELSLRAKGMLIARAHGVEIPVGDDVRSNLEELKFLERTVGPTGLLAILPLRRTSRRDLWQILLLERARGAKRADAGRGRSGNTGRPVP